MREELEGYDAIGRAELIRKGEVQAIEMMDDAIESIEKLNPKLNAVIFKDYDNARKQARACDARSLKEVSPHSSFYGIPFLLKDLLAEAKGLPLNEGSQFVDGYISKIDSELVSRQRKAGLLILGKTNASEFGLLPTTEPESQGPTVNPWDTRLTPGGSSGGSAAAVAAGIVPMAHGNDGGGSIRIPASCCGLFGLKPTRGRNPLGPLFGDMASGLICEHAVTISVRDSAALLDATAGSQPGDPYWVPPNHRPFIEEVRIPPTTLKIGLLNTIPNGWADQVEIHPDCKTAVNFGAKLCEKLGHIVEEIDPAKISWPKLDRTFSRVFAGYAAHICIYWEKELGRKVSRDQLEPITWRSLQAGMKITSGEYLSMIEELQRFSRKLACFRDGRDFDLLLSPTMAIPPTEKGAFTPAEEAPNKVINVVNAFIAFSRIQNITGDPAMSVPLFWNEQGVPIGIQFAGRSGDEASLLRLAAQLEQEQPWTNKKPPVHWKTI